jgi:hypothetical protein
MNPSSQKDSSQELDGLFQKALKKVGAKDENSICHYLPGPAGGYIHHFTLRKMRQQSPQAVADMLRKYILDSNTPKEIAPKLRAPRGSRKKKDLLHLNPSAIERLLQLAKTAGDREAIALLTPKRSLSACRKELIASIRAGRIDQDLWNSYSNTATSQEALEVPY